MPAPTRLFLRDVTAVNPPTNGEKSTALPVGVFDGNSGAGFEDRSLMTTAGGAQVSKSRAALATAAEHDDQYIARFTLDDLAAQTINANTWIVAVATSEANANANSFTILSLYVWRPSTSSVVGFVYDSDTILGIEWEIAEDGQVLSIAGSSVVCAAGDSLVLEFWRHTAGQGMATPYTQTLYFNGTTDVTETTTSDAASYIETPQTLDYLVVGQPFTLQETAVIPAIRQINPFIR